MRMKFFVTFCLGFVILITPLVAFAQTENFSDVPPTHPNSYAIKVLKDEGIVSGYGDTGEFRPDTNISRAETLAIVLKTAGIAWERFSEGEMIFNDVRKGSWFYRAVLKGLDMKKLKGYEDGTFKPENPVTLPEALALVFGFSNINTGTITIDETIYPGLDTKSWYATRAQYAKNKNLIEPERKPGSTGIFDPTAPLTRAELAELIYRFRMTQRTGREYDITSGWITTTHETNYWRLKHPADWRLFKGISNSVIWKPSGPVSFFTRIWPDSVRLSISVDENYENRNAVNYFANLKNTYTGNYPESAPEFSNKTLSGRQALVITSTKRRTIDLAIQMPDGNFLVMYGEYGDGVLSEYLKKQLEIVQNSYEFIPLPPAPEPPVPLENRMETLRANILVEGGWNSISALFPDKRLSSTDAIGIGTGPVDYYYSAEANHTIKLERNSGTILNIRENETSSF